MPLGKVASRDGPDNVLKGSNACSDIRILDLGKTANPQILFKEKRKLARLVR